MRTTDVFIGAVGTYLPDIVASGAGGDESITGTAVAGDTPAVEMALAASRQAFRRWGGSTDRCRLLLYVDAYPSGPEGWSPSAYLQREALHGDMLATRIQSGCNGFFHALELAAAQMPCLGDDAAALVAGGDNLGSPLVDRWNVLDGFAMADAASAVVLTRGSGFARLRSIASKSLPAFEQLHRGDEPLHPAGVLRGQRLDFTSRIRQFSQYVTFTQDLAVLLFKTLTEVVDQVLDEAGISVPRVTRVALTTEPQPKPDERLKALGIDPAISTWEYSRTIGHSPSDQLLALDHLLDNGELGPGDHFLMIGVGPGLNFAAAVVEIVDTPPWPHGHED